MYMARKLNDTTFSQGIGNEPHSDNFGLKLKQDLPQHFLVQKENSPDAAADFTDAVACPPAGDRPAADAASGAAADDVRVDQHVSAADAPRRAVLTELKHEPNWVEHVLYHPQMQDLRQRHHEEKLATAEGIAMEGGLSWQQAPSEAIECSNIVVVVPTLVDSDCDNGGHDVDSVAGIGQPESVAMRGRTPEDWETATELDGSCGSVTELDDDYEMEGGDDGIGCGGSSCDAHSSGDSSGSGEMASSCLSSSNANEIPDGNEVEEETQQQRKTCSHQAELQPNKRARETGSATEDIGGGISEDSEAAEAPAAAHSLSAPSDEVHAIQNIRRHLAALTPDQQAPGQVRRPPKRRCKDKVKPGQYRDRDNSSASDSESVVPENAAVVGPENGWRGVHFRIQGYVAPWDAIATGAPAPAGGGTPACTAADDDGFGAASTTPGAGSAAPNAPTSTNVDFHQACLNALSEHVPITASQMPSAQALKRCPFPQASPRLSRTFAGRAAPSRARLGWCTKQRCTKRPNMLPGSPRTRTLLAKPAGHSRLDTASRRPLQYLAGKAWAPKVQMRKRMHSASAYAIRLIV
jgi:hypothetical protein